MSSPADTQPKAAEANWVFLLDPVWMGYLSVARYNRDMLSCEMSSTIVLEIFQECELKPG